MADKVFPLFCIPLAGFFANDLKQVDSALFLHAHGASEEQLVFIVIFQLIILFIEALVRVLRLRYVVLLLNRLLEHLFELFKLD